jgi:LysR family transcriptional activator of nhaA
MRSLNYRHLRYFWAVAHDGNLTRTAKRLHLSQSALSVQIKRLEEEIGESLFERRGRGLHVTEVGRMVLDHADVIFSTEDELLRTLRGAERSRTAIRVGAMATLSRNFQIAFLGPLLSRQDIDIILRSGSTAELLTALEALNLDVVLLNHPPSRDVTTRFVSHRLAEQQVSLVGRGDRFDAGRTLKTLLSSYPVILPSTDSGIRVEFDALVDRLGIQPEVAAEVDDMAMMRLLAREGIGLAVIPPIVVTDELESGLLTEACRLPGIVESFYAISLERRFQSPLVSTLIGAIAVDGHGSDQ